MAGIAGDFELSFSQTSIVPPGQVFVFFRNNKFNIRASRKLSTMEMVLAVNNYIESQEKKKNAENG